MRRKKENTPNLVVPLFNTLAVSENVHCRDHDGAYSQCGGGPAPGLLERIFTYIACSNTPKRA